MKRLYWRPSSVPRIALVLVALLSLAGLWAVEFLLVNQKQPAYDTKMRAARMLWAYYAARKQPRSGVPV